MKTIASLICLLTASLFTFSAASFAKDTSEYPALGKRFLDAFAKAEIGQDISTLPLPKGWTHEALIQLVGGQTGIWDVWIEEGTTVFRIYPYFQEIKVRGPVGYSCIVLKVDDPSATVKQFSDVMEGLRSRKPLKVIEYSISYPDGRSTYVSNKKKVSNPK